MTAPRLRALIDAANHAMPVAKADEGRAPHVQRLFVSRQYVDFRWQLYNLTESTQDYDAWFQACRNAGVSPAAWLEVAA